jgi:hypothetical protein
MARAKPLKSIPLALLDCFVASLLAMTGLTVSRMSWRDSSGAVVVEHCAIDGICAMVNRYPSDREIASPQRRDKALARKPVRRASMKDCPLMLPMDLRIVEAEDVFEALHAVTR